MCLGFVVEAFEAGDGAEDLLAPDAGRLRHVGEEHRVHEEAAVVGGRLGPGAAGEAGARALRVGDEAVDPLSGVGGDERAHDRVRERRDRRR